MTANASHCERSAADAAILQWMRRPVSPIRRSRSHASLGDRPAVPGRGAGPVDAAGAAGARGRAGGGVEALHRSARVPAPAEGRPEAGRRGVRAAHRGARRGDAAAADAQPRHAAGDRQRDDQRSVQRHRPGDTPSRRRIFVCRPVRRRSRRDCRVRAPDSLDARAPRVSPPVDRRGRQRTAAVLRAQGAAEGGFDLGIQKALERLLVSPQFLFRIEREPANVAAGAAYRISDLELASRLSFFLWSSIPDDELLDAAAAGRLKDPTVLEQQVRRMLADPRSESLVTNFAAQWLYLRDIEAKQPDEILFPDFDETLRAAMQRETELFVDSVFAREPQRPRSADAPTTRS